MTETPQLNEEEQFFFIHEQGAKNFGAAWYKANRHALAVGQSRHLDAKQHRVLLSLMAYAMCYTMTPSPVDGKTYAPLMYLSISWLPKNILHDVRKRMYGEHYAG
jgi:hypothetical protein